MKISNLTSEQVFQALATSESGLTEAEANKRLQEFGPNEIEEVKGPSLLVKFLKQFTHFLAILLWIGAGLAFLSELLHPGGGMPALGFAIVVVIVINAVFAFVQEYRAEKSIEKLKLLLPFFVKVMRDGKEREIPARGIVPGDIVILSEGDKVPADSRLVDTTYLMVNNAPLTGESEPIPLQHEPRGGELMESGNVAFAGTTIVSGSGRAVVFATGMGTEFGRIAHLTGAVEAGLTPLQKEIVKTTRIIAFLAAIIGIAFFIVGYFIGRTFWENFIFAIGVIVALVPEGMLPTVTLALAMGSQRMARRKALIKTLASVETLGSVTVICTDKTGTLTQNRMEVKKFWFNGEMREAGRLRDSDRLPEIAYLCNNAKFIDGHYKGDPTEIALLRVVRETAGDLKTERLREIPFDSERKRMSSVNAVGGKVFAFTKGALENVLPLCNRMLLNGKEAPLDEENGKRAVDACHAMMDTGLRVLSFAFKEMDEKEVLHAGPETIERNMVFAGLMGIEDPPRPEVPDALKKCHDAGIRVIMITGDGSRTAVAIAREIGLVRGTPAVVEGTEFEIMSERELREKLAEQEVLFARMTPKHKLRIVSTLKEMGERVAVTGDGVNDAPALKKADIGIAMGISGTDVAKETAEMILLDDNFATIVNAVEEGKAIFENIRKFIGYFFTSNIAELVPYIIFVLFRVPLPLTIMQVLSVDLGTDMLPALALGAERPTKELMKQPPRSPKKRILDSRVLSLVFLLLGPIEAAAGLFGFSYVLKQGGWQWGEMLLPDNALYMQATTACLTGIVIVQIANVFVCRSFRESVFGIGFFSNKLIFAGIAFELALQLFIVYHPLGNRIFSTCPIPPSVWLVLIPFAIFLFAADEARKFIARKLRAGQVVPG